jgi:hypothetical protein
MPIKTLGHRYPRLGRISLGYQVPTGRMRGDRVETRPVVSDTLVFHSASIQRLEVLQAHYGGQITPSPLDEDKLHLVSETTEIPVLFPSIDMDRVFSQWYEAWATSGLVRRCDGEVCGLWRDPSSGDYQPVERPCICDAENLPDKDRCNPVVRLYVIPADCFLELEEWGVWMATSAGYNSNAELKGDMDLLSILLHRAGLGVRLKLAVWQAPSAKHGDRPALRINLEGTPVDALAGAGFDIPSLGGGGDGNPIAELPVGGYVPEPEPVSGPGPEGTPLEADGPVKGEGTRPTGGGSGPVASPHPIVHGIPLPHTVIAPTPATDYDPKITRAQEALILSRGAALNLTATQVGDIFSAMNGFELAAAKRDTATKFLVWLKQVQREEPA